MLLRMLLRVRYRSIYFNISFFTLYVRVCVCVPGLCAFRYIMMGGGDGGGGGVGDACCHAHLLTNYE